jgi:dihydroorotate dehydrogenase
VLTKLAMPLLRCLDPERAHRLGLRALTAGLVPHSDVVDSGSLATEVAGLRFANPIGLAAGFDKDAVAAVPLAGLGFGFVEVGTVTPRPQAGNPRPRQFRLAEDVAVINRMCFNNGGIDAYARRLGALPRPHPVPIGANLGVNKDGAEPERDYSALLARVAPFADYVVVNVSSPNTPGLRDLQSEARLAAILGAMRAAVPDSPPLFVKLAPDLSHEGLAAVVEVAVAAGVAGLILTNTTTSRPTGLRSAMAREIGGLSGRPLMGLSTRVLARAFLLARGRLALIGVGGVESGADAMTKIRAGASLVQLYTAFAYHGPALIPLIKRDLVRALATAGYQTISAAVGTDAERLAEEA